jgi:hypothetical protein
MTRIHPKKAIVVGFFLVLFGAVAPFLMVLGLVPTSFALSMLSYGASFVGLLLGIVGASWYSRLGN